MRIELLDEVDSTNKYIEKYLSGGEDVVVCAKRQTGGMGTKGRSFSSEEGGVYLTKLTFYENLAAKDSFSVMQNAAVAVCRTAQKFGVNAYIKWPNDVFVGKKKLSGTLIKNVLSGDHVRASIVGIGLNVNNDVSRLNGIATTMSECAGRKLSTEQVRDALIAELCAFSDFSAYLSFVGILGKKVIVTEGEKSYPAIAEEILPDGRLKIVADGEKTLSAAEISVKIEG